MKVLFSLFVFSSLLFGCSSIRKAALQTAAPLFVKATPGLEAEGNWQAFREGMPGNLKLLDGLLAVSPKNESLLVSSIKGNAAYAFAIHETLHLEEKLSDSDKTPHKEQAVATYSKAIDYGMVFLKEYGVTYEDLRASVKKTGGVSAYLNKKMGRSQNALEGVLFTAQSLGSLINLQREDITLVAELPIAKGMYDWVCSIQPEISHGACHLFSGAYEAGRPKILGGNPEKGKRIFQSFIKENPHNWLGSVAYIQYYMIPLADEQAYRKEKIKLKRLMRIHKEGLNWSPLRKKHEAFKDRSLRIYQAIAMKRFEIIRKYESDIF